MTGTAQLCTSIVGQLWGNTKDIPIHIPRPVCSVQYTVQICPVCSTQFKCVQCVVHISNVCSVHYTVQICAVCSTQFKGVQCAVHISNVCSMPYTFQMCAVCITQFKSCLVSWTFGTNLQSYDGRWILLVTTLAGRQDPNLAYGVIQQSQ